MSALEVSDWTERIVSQIPQHSVTRVLLMPHLPDPAEGKSGHCPKCGRSLPMFSFPPVQGWGLEPVGLGYFTDYERTLKCLVCGFNHKHGRDVPLALLLDAASRISDAMLDHG